MPLRFAIANTALQQKNTLLLETSITLVWFYQEVKGLPPLPLGQDECLFYRRVEHLAVCTEFVVGNRQQIVGLGDGIATVGDNLTGGTSIVVSAVDQHQTAIGLDAVHIPPQLAVFSNDAVLNLGLGIRSNRGLLGIGSHGGLLRLNHRSVQHLAVCTEFIVGNRQQIVGLGDGITTVGDNLAGGTSRVVSAGGQQQLAVGLDAVHIPPPLAILSNDAILLLGLGIGGDRGLLRLNHRRIEHLAICAEGIIGSRQQIVGLGDPVLLI